MLLIRMGPDLEGQLYLLRVLLRTLPDDSRNLRRPVREAIAANLGVGWGIGEKRSRKATLADARPYEDASVTLEDRDGDQTYVTAPVSMIHCSDDALLKLVDDLDRHFHGDRDNVPHGHIHIGRLPIGRRVGPHEGCGGIITGGLWLHPELERRGLRPMIERTLAGL